MERIEPKVLRPVNMVLPHGLPAPTSPILILSPTIQNHTVHSYSPTWGAIASRQCTFTTLTQALQRKRTPFPTTRFEEFLLIPCSLIFECFFPNQSLAFNFILIKIYYFLHLHTIYKTYNENKTFPCLCSCLLPALDGGGTCSPLLWFPREIPSPKYSWPLFHSKRSNEIPDWWQQSLVWPII